MNTSNSITSNYLPLPRVYLQNHPNQPIQLYKGFIEIIQGEEVIEGSGTVTFSWFPHPYVKFELTHFMPNDIRCGEILLKLIELGVLVPANISRRQSFGSNNKTVMSGYFCKPVVVGLNQNLTSIVFHISNFQWFNISNYWEVERENLEFWLPGQFEGQFVLQALGWQVSMGTLPNGFDIEETLQVQGGYGFTHVCKLERSNQAPFTVNQARDHLEAFAHYLSFARGIWIAPMLLAGFDSNGSLVWEEWCEYQASPWQENYSWFSPDCSDFVEIFSGFMRRWQDETWRELVKKSIHWYVESNNQAGGADGSIVLQQTALERLAWVLLVEDKCILSPGGFQRLSAADTMRQLLHHLGISLAIPEHMTILTDLATRRNWSDGPQAFTEVRNAINHPSPKNHPKAVLTSQVVVSEAWHLGLKYLEFVLLKLCDYPYAYSHELQAIV